MKALKSQNRSKRSFQKYLKSAAFMLAFQSAVAGATNYYEDFIPQAGDTNITNALIAGGGTVVSQWQACAAAGFMKSLDDEYKNVEKTLSTAPVDVDLDHLGMTFYERYKYIALKKAVDEYGASNVFSQLPVSVNRMLALDFGGVKSIAGRKMVKEMYRSSIVSNVSSYVHWNKEKLVSFLSAMDGDIIVNEFIHLWKNGDASSEEKNALALRVHEIHADIYGYKTVTVYSESDFGGSNDSGDEDIAIDDHIRQAYFDGLKIVYNDIHPNSNYRENDVEAFIGDIVHESKHAFQQVLIDRVNEHALFEDYLFNALLGENMQGQELYVKFNEQLPDLIKRNITDGWDDYIDPLLLRGGALREVAELFALSEDNYIKSGVDYAGYLLTHQESDAWRMEGNVADFMGFKAEDRELILSELLDSPDVVEDGLSVLDVDLSAKCSDLKLN